MQIDKIIIGGLLLMSSVVAVGEVEMTGTPYELERFIQPVKNVVAIKGHSEMKAVASKAIVSLLITTEHEKVSNSIENNQKLRSKIKAKLISAGIKEEDIRNSKFSTTLPQSTTPPQQFDSFEEEPDNEELVGKEQGSKEPDVVYKVMNRMEIGIYDDKQYKEVASISDENKKVVLIGLTYEHVQATKYEDLVREKALSAIMKQKKNYEKVLGVKLISNRIVKNDFRTDDRFYDEYVRLSSPSFGELIYRANTTVEFKVVD